MSLRSLALANTLAPALLAALLPLGPQDAPSEDELSAANPIRPIPGALLGHDIAVRDLPSPPDPERALQLFELASINGRDTRVERAQLRRQLRGR